MERVIGKYVGQERGPMLIIFGAMHGNEPAGVKAIDLMTKMLEVEPVTNEAFKYRGMMLGLIGNLGAYERGSRFIDKDLNRQWTKDIVDYVDATPLSQLSHERREIKEILQIIRDEIAEYQPEQVIVLDLHTTSSYGGIFSLATETEDSMRIAMELHAPVVIGMLKGIRGTSMHYFCTDNIGVMTTAVVFESGQHQEQKSVIRAIAAITNCMRTIGSIDAAVVENTHDQVLLDYSRDLPKMTRLVARHGTIPQDQFKMMPNYKNFQEVKKGEVIATDKDGDITAPTDAMMLMPLYQTQGEDGFFLVTQVDGY